MSRRKVFVGFRQTGLLTSRRCISIAITTGKGLLEPVGAQKRLHFTPRGQYLWISSALDPHASPLRISLLPFRVVPRQTQSMP